ncbi:sterol desaturase family protein [Vibrio europaeus]|uniref:sterol desaturase family protein n=1 Tax=Vibrio europaeus TaxID=300876 RepID=UPI00233FACC4|nr:sterol desaturase family protein [Vibrio europaeus]MDC5848787.1 sterol desaturase family protein [Vibrio europaeus]
MSENFILEALPDWLVSPFLGMFTGLYAAVTAPFLTLQRISLVFLFTSAVLALFSYLYYSKKDNRVTSIKGYFCFLVPKEIYLSNSTWVDLKVYLCNRLIYGAIAPVRVILSSATFSYLTVSVLSGLIESPAFIEDGLYSVVLWTLFYLLITDFAYFISHYADHKIPFFWEMHALHHSAKTMTPLTLSRVHPATIFFSGLLRKAVNGSLQGVFLFFIFKEATLYQIIGLSLGEWIFRTFAANLRHSHIWLHYGYVLNHIFISPAHHQIHHSARMKHWGKNNGHALAIWDWMFGTLVVPTEELRKNLVIGLSINEPDPHSSLKLAYLMPLQNMWTMAKKRLLPNKKQEQF